MAIDSAPSSPILLFYNKVRYLFIMNILWPTHKFNEVILEFVFRALAIDCAPWYPILLYYNKVRYLFIMNIL